MPGTEDTSTPSKGPVFHTPLKADVSSIIMSDKSLDLSILSQSPSIVTEDHLALINDLLEKATKKKEEWEVYVNTTYSLDIFILHWFKLKFRDSADRNLFCNF